VKHILVTYVSHSGSTREIAEFIGKQFVAQNHRVDIKAITDVLDLAKYDRIVAAGLLYRFGWHPEMIKFLTSNIGILRQKKVALLVVGLRLIRTTTCDLVDYPVYVDISIQACSQKKTCLDGFTTMDGYLKQALPVLKQINPLSLAFFGGKLDLRTLKAAEQLIMRLLMLITGITQGDKRNWEGIKTWAMSLDVLSD